MNQPPFLPSETISFSRVQSNPSADFIAQIISWGDAGMPDTPIEGAKQVGDAMWIREMTERTEKAKTDEKEAKWLKEAIAEYARLKQERRDKILHAIRHGELWFALLRLGGSRKLIARTEKDLLASAYFPAGVPVRDLEHALAMVLSVYGKKLN